VGHRQRRKKRPFPRLSHNEYNESKVASFVSIVSIRLCTTSTVAPFLFVLDGRLEKRLGSGEKAIEYSLFAFIFGKNSRE
jgi:hypothetical protein